MNGEKKEVAVFGGGCFWCTEAVFQMLKGVKSVTSGYAGGFTENPTYDEVASRLTGHAEVIKIEFDPSVISFRNLLTIFFGSHEPTSVNRQPARPSGSGRSGGGNDEGPEYRSIILYTTEAQKQESEKFIKELNDSNKEGKTIATEVKALEKFYPAEADHQNFYKNNPNYGYCEVIINPKLGKVQKEFAELLKTKAD